MPPALHRRRREWRNQADGCGRRRPRRVRRAAAKPWRPRRAQGDARHRAFVAQTRRCGPDGAEASQSGRGVRQYRPGHGGGVDMDKAAALLTALRAGWSSGTGSDRPVPSARISFQPRLLPRRLQHGVPITAGGTMGCLSQPWGGGLLLNIGVPAPKPSGCGDGRRASKWRRDAQHRTAARWRAL